MTKLTSLRVRSLALSGLWLTTAASVQALADTQAQVISTDLRSALASNEPFNVRVRFSSTEPVALWVQPYFRGKPVKGAMLAATGKYKGDGIMDSWFTLTSPGKVDEVRIMAGGGDPWRRWNVGKKSLDLEWTSEVATADVAAPGTDELRTTEDAEDTDNGLPAAERVVRSSDP